MPSIEDNNPATPSTINFASKPNAPEEMTAEQLNDQINDLFNKIEASFEHNCRAFRTRSAMVMQKVEEMEGALQDLIDSLQDHNDQPGGNSHSLGSAKPAHGPEMVMPDIDIKTPSARQ